MTDMIEQQLQELALQFAYWEKTKDLVDQLIDIILNYRQSGHPGGSRSKVHALLATLLERRDALGHPPPGEALRRPLRPGRRAHRSRWSTARWRCSTRRCASSTQQTGDERYASAPGRSERALPGRTCSASAAAAACPGHAEMAGKTLFLKFNTGPSGHGSPAAAGEALALKRAGAAQVRGLCLRGRGRPDRRARRTRR